MESRRNSPRGPRSGTRSPRRRTRPTASVEPCWPGSELLNRDLYSGDAVDELTPVALGEVGPEVDLTAGETVRIRISGPISAGFEETLVAGFDFNVMAELAPLDLPPLSGSRGDRRPIRRRCRWTPRRPRPGSQGLDLMRKPPVPTFRFRFLSSEPGSSFRCSLDRQPFTPCGAAKNLGGQLSKGRHRLRVYAMDPAGNVDPTPAVARFRFPRPAPRQVPGRRSVKSINPFRRWPRLSKAVLVSGLALAALVAAANVFVFAKGGNSTSEVADVSAAEVAIVPGALVEPDGEDERDACRSGQAGSRALARGQGGEDPRFRRTRPGGSYDEPDTMRKALVAGRGRAARTSSRTTPDSTPGRRWCGRGRSSAFATPSSSPRASICRARSISPTRPGSMPSGLTADLHSWGYQGRKSSRARGASRGSRRYGAVDPGRAAAMGGSEDPDCDHGRPRKLGPGATGGDATGRVAPNSSSASSRRSAGMPPSGGSSRRCRGRRPMSGR